MFVEGIFCGLVRIFIPNSGTFSFVREKKNRQTNRETNTNLRIDFLDKPGGGGALIFFVRVADVYWRCQKIYPNST